MVVRRAGLTVLVVALAGVLAACGGGHRTPPATTAVAATTAPDAGIERLVAAVPPALPERLLVEGNVLVTGRFTVVSELSGPVSQVYALVPPGEVVHPKSSRPTCEITYGLDDGTEATRRSQFAAFENLRACQGQLGCGQLVIASIEGESAAAKQANAAKLAEYQACLEAVERGPGGPPVDGRFLLQPAPSSPSAGLPVAVVVYPSAAAFAASAEAVADGTAFRQASVLGRFEPTSLIGCALQFYPATAAAMAWCGGHDPEHDATVHGLADQLSSAVDP